MAWVADSGRQKLWWFGLVWFATHASFDIGGQPKPTGKTASTVGLRFDRPPHRSQQHCALEGNCSGNMQLKVHNGMTTRRVFSNLITRSSIESHRRSNMSASAGPLD